MKVNVLGTDYKIETHKISKDDYLREMRFCGYCAEESKLIVIADMSEKEYFPNMDEKEQETFRKKTLRHEITHAFLNESGLSDCAYASSGAWSKNEEMVDWIAIQGLKLYKAWQDAGAV